MKDPSPEVEALLSRLVASAVDDRTRALTQKLEALEAELAAVRARTTSDRASIIVFSGDMDKLLSAFIIASGAAAMGLEVSLYFTFWGLAAVRRSKVYSGKSVVEKMLALMLPGGPDDAPSSSMNMLGMGPLMFKHVMKEHHVETLPDLIAVARELGVRMVACQMSMGVMGIRKEELIDGLEFGGVATYLGDATDSKITLFI